MEAAYRSSLRGQLTKIVNQVNEYLSKLPDSSETNDVKLENLYTYISRIENIHKLLNEVDATLRSTIKEENAVAECSSVIDYNDKATTAIARARYRIQALHNTSVESTAYRNNNGNDESNTTTNATNTSRTTAYIKLPKLELRKFNGEFDKWIPFWEQFKVAIHWNAQLDDASKFSYLQSALTGKAASTIAGMIPTESSYKEAIEMLKEEYGNNDRIVDKYLQELMSIKAVKSRNDATALRELYTAIMTAIRSLTTFNISPSQYNIMLKSIILRALPSELKIEYFRIESHKDKRTQEDENTSANELETTTNTTIECDPMLKPLLRFLRVEVESLERASVVSASEEKRTGEKSRYNCTTAAGLLSVIKTPKCLFCDSLDHFTINCEFPMAMNEKKEKLKVLGRCFKCTFPKHTSKYCKNKHIRCKKCKGNHASTMCDPNFAEKAVVNSVARSNAKEYHDINTASEVNLLSHNSGRILLQAVLLPFLRTVKCVAFDL